MSLCPGLIWSGARWASVGWAGLGWARAGQWPTPCPAQTEEGQWPENWSRERGPHSAGQPGPATRPMEILTPGHWGRGCGDRIHFHHKTLTTFPDLPAWWVLWSGRVMTPRARHVCWWHIQTSWHNDIVRRQTPGTKTEEMSGWVRTAQTGSRPRYQLQLCKWWQALIMEN